MNNENNNKWLIENQISRNKQIKNWAINIKNNNNNWRDEHTKLINSIFNKSITFYDNLLKSQEGVDIVIRRFKIKNPKIIKRLKNNAKDIPLNLLIKENEKFIKI
jgi:hypothetical protein